MIGQSNRQTVYQSASVYFYDPLRDHYGCMCGTVQYKQYSIAQRTE
jgi:hypothetical protein